MNFGEPASWGIHCPFVESIWVALLQRRLLAVWACVMVVLPRLFVFEVWRNVRLDIGWSDVAGVVVDVWELGFMKSARGW